MERSNALVRLTEYGIGPCLGGEGGGLRGEGEGGGGGGILGGGGGGVWGVQRR